MIRKVIAITMGDPAGVGSEIVVKSLNNPAVYDECIPVVIGDYLAIKDALDFCNLSLNINKISDIRDARGQFGTIDLYDMNLLSFLYSSIFFPR